MARRRPHSDRRKDLVPEDPPAETTTEAPAAPCRLHWLDARRGILASAADWLLAEAGAERAPGTAIDLSGFTVVVPGRGAGHRLIEILIDKTDGKGRRIVPPTTVTLGTLPEELYEPARPLADSVTETLCWVAALSAASRSDRQLIAPGPADEADDDAASSAEVRRDAAESSTSGLLDAARMLVSMHRELAANALSFADLTKAADAALPAFGDHARWQALARLEEVYLAEIDGLGFWDRQTARRVAVERGEVNFDDRIVLLATVDVDPLQRRLLAGVRGRIDALVALPADIGPEPRACFDDFGCIVPAAWDGRPIPVPLERIAVVEDSDAEAAAVVNWMRNLASKRAADEFSIAVPDPAVVPALEQRLAAAGLAGRYAAGRTVERSSPWQLVHAIFAWMRRREFSALADLLRCPDCIELVRRRTGETMPAAIADGVGGRHLPWEVVRDHIAAAGSHPDEQKENAVFVKIVDCIDGWLEPLQAAAAAIDAAARSAQRHGSVASRARSARKSSGRAGTTDARRSVQPARRSAAAATQTTLARAWVASLRGVCAAAVDGIEIDRDDLSTRVFARARSALGEELAELETIPDRLAAAAGSTGLERLLLSTWGRSALPPASEPTAIDIVGWLEVALDDSAALAITGCVEGCLPGSAGRDPLLPEPLRQALGLDNAARTAARDAWMLAVAAGREDLLVVVPRRRADGAPAVPSRLLFRRDPDAVVAAAKRLFAKPSPPLPAGPPAVMPSRLEVPNPSIVVPGGSALHPPMRVTEFRDYLACPYRYWLRHRLRLGIADDDSLELGPGDFGTLIHECLDLFAKDPLLAASTSAEEIAAGLSAILDRLVDRRYGSGAAPAVFVQAELARRRLRQFASVQASRTAAGWAIHSTEQVVRSSALVVDGQPVTLSGKIDRIDHHAGEDRWEVLDYKTSKNAKTPDQTHRDPRGWIDLQLPLYRHLLVEVGGLPEIDLANPDRIGVGYFNVPARVEEIRIDSANWSAEEYESADDTARDVVRAVREGVFWPPNPDAAGTFPEFDSICQTHAIRDDEEEESP